MSSPIKSPIALDLPPLTRRYFFLGALSLSASGAFRSPQASAGPSRGGSPIRRPAVSITSVPQYGAPLDTIVRRIFDDHRLDCKNRRVVIKPNLVEFASGSPINTHPALVKAVFDEAFVRGASCVIIAEGPGHRRATLDLADAAGYFDLMPQFERSFVDLNLDEVSQIVIPRPQSKLTSIYLPKTILGCDLLISLAKMKTHHWAGATLSMKNLFGIVPGSVYGWPKNVLHWAGIPECIVDLQSVVPNQFAIVDGIVAMEGNGPILGTAKAAGVVVAGRSPVAVDTVCCRLMGLNPERVSYLRLARRLDRLTSAPVEIGENPGSRISPFALPPGMEDLRSRTL
jgi:uncharacterized protein (DUF362 family)